MDVLPAARLHCAATAAGVPTATPPQRSKGAQRPPTQHRRGHPRQFGSLNPFSRSLHETRFSAGFLLTCKCFAIDCTPSGACGTRVAPTRAVQRPRPPVRATVSLQTSRPLSDRPGCQKKARAALRRESDAPSVSSFAIRAYQAPDLFVTSRRTGSAVVSAPIEDEALLDESGTRSHQVSWTHARASTVTIRHMCADQEAYICSMETEQRRFIRNFLVRYPAC